MDCLTVSCLSVWWTPGGCDSAIFFRYGFQVLDDCPALFVGQQRSDDAIPERAVLEGVALVRISGQRGVHKEPAGLFARVQPHFDRIELAPDVELLGAFLCRDQHLVKIRY